MFEETWPVTWNDVGERVGAGENYEGSEYVSEKGQRRSERRSKENMKYRVKLKIRNETKQTSSLNL